MWPIVSSDWLLRELGESTHFLGQNFRGRGRNNSPSCSAEMGTELHQIFVGHRIVVGTPQVCLKFQISCSFSELITFISKYEPQFRTFCPCKMWGNMSEKSNSEEKSIGGAIGVCFRFPTFLRFETEGKCSKGDCRVKNPRPHFPRLDPCKNWGIDSMYKWFYEFGP